MKYIRLIILLIIFITLFTITKLENINYKYQYVYKEQINIPVIKEDVLETFNGVVTGYGPDCIGCSGITASGYNVLNTIYYIDKEYDKVRVVASDRKYPFGTIVRFTNIDNYENYIAIVLDRGGAIGNDKKAQFDLLFASENESSNFGRKYNVKFEILRYGYNKKTAN